MRRKHQPGCPCCDGGDVPPCTPTCIQVFGCNCLPLSGASVSIPGMGEYVTDSAGQACVPPLAAGEPATAYTVTISYPGMTTVVIGITFTCYGPLYDFNDLHPDSCAGDADRPGVQLQPEAGYHCGCGCPQPLPDELTITTPKASGTLVWNGSNWNTDLTWHDDDAVKVITGTSDLGGHCTCCKPASGTVKAHYVLTCSQITDTYGHVVWVWGMTAQFPGCVMAKAATGSPRDNDCYKLTAGGFSTPWCDSQGATEYDTFRLGNIAFGTYAGGLCDWSDTVPVDCELLAIDFSGTPSFPGLTCGDDIPATATVSP